MSRPSIDDRFRAFHSEHPGIWELFEKWALHEIEQRGAKRVSSKMLIEKIRAEYGPSVEGAGRFSINNDYTSRYARLFVQKYPNHRDKFEFRKIPSRRPKVVEFPPAKQSQREIGF